MKHFLHRLSKLKESHIKISIYYEYNEADPIILYI